MMIVAMVLLAQGCTINIGASSESSPVIPEQIQELSFISAPLQAISLLKTYGAYCDAFQDFPQIKAKQDGYSLVNSYEVNCWSDTDSVGMYSVSIFETEDDLLDNFASVCSRVSTAVRQTLGSGPDVITYAFGKNWEAIFVGKHETLTISDVATALGGKVGGLGDRCQFGD